MNVMPRQVLWITVRDSETGDRSLQLFEAAPPPIPRERERALNQLVPRVYPGAALRTYAQGEGTFIDGPRLIEASSGPRPEDRPVAPLPGAEERRG